MKIKSPKKLLEEIQATGMTQEEIAERLGIWQATVSKHLRADDDEPMEMRSTAFTKLQALHAEVCAKAVH